jgi:hypothetical protein
MESIEKNDPAGEETADRVRRNTAREINSRIDQEIEDSVSYYATRSRGEITRRIEELEREWDMERLLETNASALAFCGVVLAATHSRKWLIVPGIVSAFLFQHAVQGWCPPVPLFRRLGVRTRKEIDREKYALKALRGDFEDVSPEAQAAGGSRAGEALAAARE